MDAPLTVLLCVHNGAAYLRESLESLLAQTWRDFELLVIDDASTDATVSIIESVNDPRLRLLRNERNLGLTASLNRGLREARGVLIARQDADDRSAPDRFARQVDFLRTHPEVALVGSQAWMIDAAGHRVGRLDTPLGAEGIRWVSWLLNPIIHTAVMFRREAILGQLGGYDEAYSCCQDFELWTRVMARFEVRNLPERLVSYRVHAESVSATRQETAQRLVRQVVERELERAGVRAEYTEAEVAVMARYRWSLEPEEVETALGMLAKVEVSARRGAADLARTKAWARLHLGYGLLTKRPLLAWRQILRAAAQCPGYALTWPWAKMAALSVLGPRARQLFLSWRDRRPATSRR